MSNENDIESAVRLETERCAELVRLHVDVVNDPLMKSLLLRISNLILLNKPATKEAIDFLRQIQEEDLSE